MIQPTQSDIGRRVLYRERRPGSVVERGVLTGFNESYAFVNYGRSGAVSSQATAFADLEWDETPRRIS